MNTDTTTVYVVSSAPAREDLSGVGGFTWAPCTPDGYAEAVSRYTHEVRESASEGGTHVVRLVPVRIRWTEFTIGEVTDHLDARLDEIEVTLPALRQYVPPTTAPDRVPSARVIR